MPYVGCGGDPGKSYRCEPPSAGTSVLTESDRMVSPERTYRGRVEESTRGLHPENTGGIHGGGGSDGAGEWQEVG